MPARVIAVLALVPLRLVHDLVLLVGRGLRVLLRAPAGFVRLLGRLLGAVWGVLYSGLLAPFGRLVAAAVHAVADGIGWLASVLLLRPLRWLGIVVILGALRLIGRGTGRVARWIYRVLLAPTGRFLTMLARGLGVVLEILLLHPLRLLGVGLAWLGHAAAMIARGMGAGLLWLLTVLVVMPVVLLWRHVLWPYVLRPPLLVAVWLVRGTGRLVAAFWNVLATSTAWSWRLLGRGLALLGRALALLGRILFVLPALAVWRYALAPIGRGIAGTWRLTARVLRRLWTTFAIVPTRWIRRSVLAPVGRGVRDTWRVAVREPMRSVHRTMRETSTEVRQTLRRTFRGH
ncbi:hypothetical protein [Actinomadura roseirufa]|uniref:hypothetical protein n=1 Tax=Actinomadura roseirufa TaxID=2094049 RepID=UPI00104173A3|nr:hypothetical protein [Actinomadura roseirufa]